jgi:hypothetical protein
MREGYRLQVPDENEARSPQHQKGENVARSNQALISALRTTAARLQLGAHYRWTHLGACNCGHLAQTVTQLDADAIRRYAMERAGEWADQVLEFCPTSGYPIDEIFRALFALGLTRDDLAHLEKLSAPEVLRRLPVEQRVTLSFRDRDHVIVYLRAFADLLEEQLPALPVSSDPIVRVA